MRVVRAVIASMAAVALALGVSAGVLAGDRYQDPIGDTQDPDRDIVAIRTVARTDAVIIEVEAARDWPADAYVTVELFTIPTDCRRSGAMWGAAYQALGDPLFLRATGSVPRDAEPPSVALDHVLDGPRYVMSVPLAALGNPEQLELMVYAGIGDRWDSAPDRGSACYPVSLVPETGRASAPAEADRLSIGLLVGFIGGLASAFIALLIVRHGAKAG